MLDAGIVHIEVSRSISLHLASLASLDRAAVKIRNRKHSLAAVTREPMAFIASGTFR